MGVQLAAPGQLQAIDLAEASRQHFDLLSAGFGVLRYVFKEEHREESA